MIFFHMKLDNISGISADMKGIKMNVASTVDDLSEEEGENYGNGK